ncbi:MAG: histidine kinase [Acidobacteria bacterium]|nr:histidine kinase [Acidobacteriota bacterium]
MESWSHQLGILWWALPLIGVIWSTTINFGAQLLRHYVIPLIPQQWGGFRIGWACSMAGVVVGAACMWVIMGLCQGVLGFQVSRSGSEWTQAGIAGLLGVVFANMFYAFHENDMEIKKAQHNEAELERQYRLNELMTMNMRIRPHFFFNSLNTLASLVSSDPDRAQFFLNDLGDLFRMSFAHGEKDHMGPWEDELAITEAYLMLEKTRFGSRLNWQVEVNASSHDPFPAFFLQPLVENAVHHGISQRPDGGTLRIFGQFVDGHWSLAMTNDVETDMEPVIEDGHALGVLKRRAELMNGRLDATCSNGVFEVHVSFDVLPIKSNVTEVMEITSRAP